MGDPLEIGLVGAGNRAQSHVSCLYHLDEWNYVDCDSPIDYPHWTYDEHSNWEPDWVEDVSDLDVSITGLFDPDPEARATVTATCREYGDDPDGFETFTEFLSEREYDGVVLVSPNDLHAEQSVRLLEEGVDVLCEKPIGITLKQHDEIIDATEATNALYYVAFNLRSSPYYTQIKAMIDDGAIGDLGMITCIESRGHFHAPYSFSKDRSGGTLLDKNCHDFDLFSWFADADPDRVFALGGQHVFDVDTDVNDHTTMVVEFEDGTKGTLDLCMYAPFKQRTRLYEFRGREGLLRTPDREPGAESERIQETIDLHRHDSRSRFRAKTPNYGGHGGADIVQTTRFVRCLQGRAEPPATVYDAKRADAMALAGEAAIETGEVVEIDDQFDFHV